MQLGQIVVEVKQVKPSQYCPLSALWNIGAGLISIIWSTSNSDFMSSVMRW